MTIEIVDFPIENGGSFHSYVKLPEGTPKSHGEKAHVPHGSLAIDPPDDGRALSCCASSAEKT